MSAISATVQSPKKKGLLWAIRKNIWLYVLLLPGLIHYVLFKYIPMWGILIAFQDYNAYKGFLGSDWIGFKNFIDFFGDPDFVNLLVNTLVISFYNIIFSFPAPIILALLLNELRAQIYKRIVQTMVYVPHFISWVIVASLTYTIFNADGIVNGVLAYLGKEPVAFLTSVETFRPLIIGQTIWKECGWGTIIFLAAISGVDMEQYEAAIVDGAGRFRQLWHITLPAIRGTIVIMLVLRMGSVLDNGFDQIFLMSNSLNRTVSQVFDTYVYTMGITRGAFSYSTAVGLFKGLIGVVLIFSSNKLAKKLGNSGIF